MVAAKATEISGAKLLIEQTMGTVDVEFPRGTSTQASALIKLLDVGQVFGNQHFNRI